MATVLRQQFAQKSTKEDLNFIARFFRRFVDAIKKVFDGNKKYQQYVYDAEKLLGVFERAVKDFDAKKAPGNSQVKYKLSTNQKLPYKKQIEICEDESKWKKGEPVFVAETSEYLKAADIDDLPIVMNVDTVKKAKRIQTLTQHGHKLNNETLFKIPDLIKKPTLLFESNSTKDYGIESRVIISNYFVQSPKNHQKCPLLIALHLNRHAGFQEVNLITSVYGKDSDPRGFIAKHIIDGNLIGYSKKEAEKLLRPMGLQLPGGNTAIDFDNILSQESKNVNTKSALSSKSATTSASAGENSVFDDNQRKDVISALSNIAK